MAEQFKAPEEWRKILEVVKVNIDKLSQEINDSLRTSEVVYDLRKSCNVPPFSRQVLVSSEFFGPIIVNRIEVFTMEKVRLGYMTLVDYDDHEGDDFTVTYPDPQTDYENWFMWTTRFVIGDFRARFLNLEP